MSEHSTLRQRQAAADQEADRLDVQGGPLPASMLVKTKAVGTYPTAPGSYFACTPVTPGGAEVEGGDGTFTEGTETIFALHSGATVPPVGTMVIVSPVGGRWVFVYG